MKKHDKTISALWSSIKTHYLACSLHK